jgi:hypothetical protein
MEWVSGLYKSGARVLIISPRGVPPIVTNYVNFDSWDGYHIIRGEGFARVEGDALFGDGGEIDFFIQQPLSAAFCDCFLGFLTEAICIRRR